MVHQTQPLLSVGAQGNSGPSGTSVGLCQGEARQLDPTPTKRALLVLSTIMIVIILGRGSSEGFVHASSNKGWLNGSYTVKPHRVEMTLPSGLTAPELTRMQTTEHTTNHTALQVCSHMCLQLVQASIAALPVPYLRLN
eukprot:SAG31_NODE_12579_length_931_cov_1.307692_1_plen_139_part_00